MLYYDLSTTAIFAGATTVCINYAGTQFPADSTDDPLSLFHFENGTWVDVTTSRNVAMNTICGQTTSLSPFAVFQRSLDIVPPVTTASLLPQPNSVGWNTQAVTVTLRVRAPAL